MLSAFGPGRSARVLWATVNGVGSLRWCARWGSNPYRCRNHNRLQGLETSQARRDGALPRLVLFLGSLAFSPSLGPAFFHFLPGPAEGQRVRGDILSNAGARGHIRPFADAHRRHQRSVTADERAIFNHCEMFLFAVVIAGD